MSARCRRPRTGCARPFVRESAHPRPLARRPSTIPDPHAQPFEARLLLPSFLCAAGLGARAGTPPSCHYTTSDVTTALLQLATTARQALSVRAVVDGAQGEEGMIVVAPT